MSTKNKKIEPVEKQWELVRITDLKVLKKVKDNKKKYGTNIGRYFEIAAAEKLVRDAAIEKAEREAAEKLLQESLALL